MIVDFGEDGNGLVGLGEQHKGLKEFLAILAFVLREQDDYSVVLADCLVHLFLVAYHSPSIFIGNHLPQAASKVSRRKSHSRYISPCIT